MAMRGDEWSTLSLDAQTEVHELFSAPGKRGSLDHIFAVRRVSTALGALLVCGNESIASWRAELDAALDAARHAAHKAVQP